MLKTLVALGYCLQHGAAQTYTLSGKLLDIAGPQSGDTSLVLSSYDALHELRDATGETVQLLIESGGKALVLEKLRGTPPLQVCGQVELRTPLYSSAPGKAILAWWSDKLRGECFRGRTLKQFTATTLADRERLVDELVASQLRMRSRPRSRAEASARLPGCAIER